METIQKVATGLIVILGLVHIFAAFQDFDGHSMAGIRYAAAGVAVVFAGFLNIALIRIGGEDWVIWVMCLIANIVFLLFFAAAVYIFGQTQEYVGLFLIMLLTIFVIFGNTEKGG